MTLTFNTEKYKELLTAYVPKLIKTEAENEQNLAIIEDLMQRERTPEEDEGYQLLITLIEKFEQEYYSSFQINEVHRSCRGERRSPLLMYLTYLQSAVSAKPAG